MQISSPSSTSVPRTGFGPRPLAKASGALSALLNRRLRVLLIAVGLIACTAGVAVAASTSLSWSNFKRGANSSGSSGLSIIQPEFRVTRQNTGDYRFVELLWSASVRSEKPITHITCAVKNNGGQPRSFFRSRSAATGEDTVRPRRASNKVSYEYSGQETISGSASLEVAGTGGGVSGSYSVPVASQAVFDDPAKTGVQITSGSGVSQLFYRWDLEYAASAKRTLENAPFSVIFIAKKGQQSIDFSCQYTSGGRTRGVSKSYPMLVS